MNYSEFLQQNNKKNILLFEIDLGVQLTEDGWIKDEGSTWKLTYSWQEEVINFAYGIGAWGFGAYGSSGSATLSASSRPEALKISSIIVDGVALSEATTLSLCRITGQTYYFDDINQILYINNDNYILDPSNTYNIITIGITKGFSNISGYYSGIYYDGRISKISDITTNRDNLFYGKISFEGGSVDLINTDGLFDNFGEQDIYGAEVRIYYGSDEIDSGDQFEIQYTGTLEDYQIDADSITINFIDSRKFLSTKVPTNILDITTYPSLNSANIGSIIPIGYGKINKAEAICLNEDDDTATTYNFIFVDTTNHDIQSIDQVYVEGSKKTPTASSTSAGTFSLSNTDYEPGNIVTIDFTGFVDDLSNLIDNPLDIIVDILTTYTNISYNSIFFDTTNWDAVTSSLTEKIGILIGEKKEIVEIVEDISSSILGILYIEGDGKFSYYLRDVSKTESDTIYVDNLLKPASVEFISDEYINSARVKYNRFWSSDRGSFYTDTSQQQSLFEKYRKNSEREFVTVLSEEVDAQNFATEALDTFGGIFPTYDITTPTNFIDLRITDNVKLEVKRLDDGTSALIKGEVLSKSLDLNNFTIDFTIRFVESYTIENLVNIIRYIY